MTAKLPTLNLHHTAAAVAAAAYANRVPLVLGSPGIAKTSMMRALTPLIGAAIGSDEYQLVDCVLSNRDAVDVGGYPMAIGEHVELKLFGSLREASERPSFLLLDEFLTCSQAVQGPAMRLVLEGVAGETPLHRDTRIACAANDPDQAPGGIQMTAALVNRLVILRCRPEIAEVSAYFCNKPEAALDTGITLPKSAAEWQERKAKLMDTAGIVMSVRPDMVCLDPPPGSISDGEPFASPRAWEICCDVLAALPPSHIEAVSPVVRAITLGTLGMGTGLAFLSLMRARQHLPSVQDVITRPDTAKLPDESVNVKTEAGETRPIGKDVTFATIPLVVEAARVDTFAAWVYAARLPSEIQAALAKGLSTQITSPADSPWRKRGQETMLDVIKRMTGANVKKAS